MRRPSAKTQHEALWDALDAVDISQSAYEQLRTEPRHRAAHDEFVVDLIAALKRKGWRWKPKRRP